jgi:hypothetical protein
MATDLLGAIARHQPDDHTADGGHQDDPCPKSMTRWRMARQRQALEEKQIREQPDCRQQQRRARAADHADHQRKRRQHLQPVMGSEITATCGGRGMGSFS